VAGAMLVVIAMGAIPAGAAGLLLERAGRDSSGYIATDSQHFSADGYALTTSPGAIRLEGSSALMERLLGDVRVSGTSATTAPLFIGIGPTADVTAYLNGVEHSVVTFTGRRSVPVYRDVAGTAPSALPGAERFWVAKTAGTGPLVVDWQPRSGDWTVVVLNADGTRAVAADLKIGATLPWLDDLSFSLVAIGLLLLLIGAVLIAMPLRSRPRPVVEHHTAGV